MLWVIDCSFSASLFLPDESSAKTASFFTALSKSNELTVPLLWWHEITNVLSVSLRKNLLKHADIINIISLINELEITTDSEYGSEYIKKIYDISQTYRVSAYDAAYLELALRKKSSLASLDNELCNAAEKAGLSILKI